MALPVPRSLSPSKVTAFTQCALAFRYSVVDGLPEPPSTWATKGTLVHGALERLHLLPPSDRTLEAALACLDQAAAALRHDPEYVGLELSDDEEAAFHADAGELVRNYFRLEDPQRVRAIGLELTLEADIDGVLLRGIIDRLELDAHGELVVTDYKTGAAPPEQYERRRLSGVHLYSLLCEKLLGRRPRRVQLLYLRSPVAIIAEPTDRTTRSTRRTLDAIARAVERACEREDFRPQPSRLCDHCAFRPYCPAFGGDPGAAQALGAGGATGSPDPLQPAGPGDPPEGGAGRQQATALQPVAASPAP